MRRRVDGQVFACKQLELSRLSSTGMAQLHEEVNAMRALDHPHICRLREVFYSEKRRCYLVLELCRGGELFDVLDRRVEPGKPRGALSERRVAQLLTMMVGCIQYMHDTGVCHRDIKLENWLFDTEDVDGDAHLKLVDFGLAKVFGPVAPTPPADGGRRRPEFTERVGSAYYCAPEILGGDYDRRCDLWSLGVIAYMLLCGAPPFWGATDRDILKRVKSLELSFPDELFRNVGDVAKDFVARLLERDVDRRLTPPQALAHPFLAEVDSLESMALETLSGLSEYVAPIHEYVVGPQPPSDLLVSLRTFAKLNAFTKLVVEVVASQLPPEKLLSLRDDFLRADVDGNGVLSLDELRAALGTGVDGDELANLFESVDVDGSHTVGFHEFVAAAVVRRIDIDDQALHAAFDAIDSEGLGYITPESVRATVGIDAAHYGDDGDIDRALSLADSDGDGKVDYAEFLDFVKKARLDSALAKVEAASLVSTGL